MMGSSAVGLGGDGGGLLPQHLLGPRHVLVRRGLFRQACRGATGLLGQRGDRGPRRISQIRQLALELLGADGEPFGGFTTARVDLVRIAAGVGPDALCLLARLALDLLRPALGGLDDRLHPLGGGGG